MPRLLAVSLFIPLIALLPAPAAPVPKHLMPKDEIICFPTRVGDRLVHDLSGAEVVEQVANVEKTEAGLKITLAQQTVIATARGLMVVEYAGQKLDPPVWFLKLPHHNDNRWTETWKMGNETWNLETAGWEDVKVPAGTFRAIRVERTEVSLVSGLPRGGTTYWYAPGLGCIKWSSRNTTRELTAITHEKQ
jgi:hypothetical protein